MKRIICAFISVVMAFVTLFSFGTTAFAVPAGEDNDFPWKTYKSSDGLWEYDKYTYYSDNSTYARLLAYFGDDENLVIPDKIDGLKVRLTYGTLYHKNPIKKVTLNKYMGNPKLIDVNFDIDELEEFIVPENNTYLKAVDGVLMNADKTSVIECPKKLKKDTYVVPASVTDIGFAFSNNKTIKTLDFSKTSLKTLYGCEGMSALQTVKMPKTVTCIDEYAFLGCKKLSNIKLSKNVKTIGIYAFYECKALKDIKLPSKLSRIGYSAFTKTGIKSITLPASVTYVELPAFNKDTKVSKQSYLKKVKTGDSEKYIAYTYVKKDGKTKKYCASDITKIAPTKSCKSISLKKNGTKSITTNVWTKGTKRGVMDNEILSFKSSDTKVVKVNSKGKLTALKKGTAKVTVKLKTTGKSYTIKVTVK